MAMPQGLWHRDRAQKNLTETIDEVGGTRISLTRAGNESTISCDTYRVYGCSKICQSRCPITIPSRNGISGCFFASR